MTLPEEVEEWSQQKISSPSVGASDAGPSGNGEPKGKGKDSQKKRGHPLSVPKHKSSGIQMDDGGQWAANRPPVGPLTGSVNEVGRGLSLPLLPLTLKWHWTSCP